MSGGSQPSVTLVSGDLMPSFNTCEHCTCVLKPTLTHMYNFKKKVRNPPTKLCYVVKMFKTHHTHVNPDLHLAEFTLTLGYITSPCSLAKRSICCQALSLLNYHQPHSQPTPLRLLKGVLFLYLFWKPLPLSHSQLTRGQQKLNFVKAKVN